MPKTRIICTLGPASDQPGVLMGMVRAGMDVVRLNFSHGKLEDHLERIARVRTLNKKYRRHIRILGDLEGFRIRIGSLKSKDGVALHKGQEVWLSQSSAKGANVLPFDYRGPVSQIKKGAHIFIDDGNIALVTEGHRSDSIKARVIVPGIVKEHKGINIPDVALVFKGVTARDKAHIAFCLENKVDMIAQSFVRTPKDILYIRKEIGAASFIPQVIAKIENREGIRNIRDIIDVCDGIMVARGDMGVSLPVYQVPMVQKMIIRECRSAGKFVITATQMLESMTVNVRPTRAEVSDVANAILDGTDYVMLSAESAVGAHPVQAVDMMNKIAKFTEVPLC